MKIMSRNFTLAEKILLVLLVIVLIAMIYYRVVYLNINNSITSSEAEKQSLQTELEVAKAKADSLTNMQAELDSIMGSPSTTRMESYNNSKAETAFLSGILSTARDYSVSFADVTRNGDQIRRSFSLQYRTSSYTDAEAIMVKLSQGEYRCLIGDVNCSIADDGQTTMGMTATFYETMVGGTPDSGLPVDQAETNNTADELQ